MEGDDEPQEVQDEGPKDKGQKDNVADQKKKIDNRRMPINGETIYKGYCDIRIHELAQPRRWLLLYTYKNYRQYFESDRAQAIKEKVQELFGMTPEAAELYFNTIRQKKPNKSDIRFLRQRIRRERKAARKEALCVFRTVLKKAMKYAFTHSPPLLVTPMLRMVSDHMLEMLADLHKVDLPKRSNCDNMSTFLISVADWCALFVSNIYYDLEVENRKEEKLRMEQDAIPCSDASSSTGKADADEEKKMKVTDYSGRDGQEGQDGEGDDEMIQQQEEL